ncbi:uncharacterized protein [Dermacentor andersoni]|uniref:uncharacterized protein isoform X5 n=1 Tax=Dermacentor andersoni TaxID=34620 RepID=UPI00241813B4|nr:uncharacterized protein LOC126544439 isoform X5 [Dermacentor andersoni]
MEVKESRAAASRRKRLENLNSSDPEVVAWQLAVERRKNERAKAKRAAETPEQREERLTKRRRREAQRRASQHQRQDQESVTDDPKTRRCTNKRKQPGRCSRRGNVPVESAKAVQTEATGSFPGRVDVAVGTSRVVDRDVCKSAQTSLAAEKVHVWTETVDLDAQDSGPCVGKISELSSPQKFEDGL